MTRSLLRAGLALVLLAAMGSAQGVRINEIHTGNPDWIEISNLGEVSVDVSGWALRTSFAFTVYPEVFLPLGTELDPGESLIVLEQQAILPPTLPAPPLGTTEIHTGFGWGWVGNSSGAAVLVDPNGAGVDLVIFGTDTVVIPGGSTGAVFEGQIDRSQNATTGDDAIFRLTAIDSDTSDDWDVGPTSSATPGAPNPTQGDGGLEIAHLLLAEPADLTLNPDGSFSASAVIEGVVTSGGVEVTNPTWDPVIGGSLLIAGNWVATHPPSLGGLVLGAAQIVLTSTVGPGDRLTFVNSFQGASQLAFDFGGPGDATPQRFRRIDSTGIGGVSRIGAGSLVLDALALSLQTELLALDVRIDPTGPVPVALGIDLPPHGQGFRAALGAPAPGQVEIGVVGAPGSELYNVFVPEPWYPLGSGGVAGIEIGDLQWAMIVSPLGTEPFHDLPNPDGSYNHVSPAGFLPPGMTLEMLAVRVTPATIEALPPLRVVVP